MQKRVLIDALLLTDRKPKGVHIYTLNLLKELALLESNFEFTVLINSRKNDSEFPKTAKLRYEKIDTNHPSLWRLLRFGHYIRKRNFDLIHFTTGNTVLHNISVPYIITVNESLKKYYLYSERRIGLLDVKKRIFKILQLILWRKILENAAILIAVSKNTKKDLRNEYKLREDKIRVIYYGIDEAFLSKKNGNLFKNKVPETPYILIFATGDKRENVFCELKAFARIKDKIEHCLFIAGIPEGKFQKELKKICERQGVLERTIFSNFLETDDLAPLYRNAGLYVDMSFLEGFGLQVAEAMASGIPVIASNVDSLPEVAGNAGILLAPDDDEALAGAMLRVLKDNRKQKEMSEASRAQAQKFSWRKTAEETLKIYDEVICRRFR